MSNKPHLSKAAILQMLALYRDSASTGACYQLYDQFDVLYKLVESAASVPLAAQPEPSGVHSALHRLVTAMDGVYSAGEVENALINARQALAVPPATPEGAKDGAALIAVERERQQSVEGWTPEPCARVSPVMPIPDALKSAPSLPPALRECLSDLFALVKGECPRLLNEDSGGDARLALRIEAALASSAAPETDNPLRLLLCEGCIEEHVRNTQSISCYCDCHSSSRDEKNWPANRDRVHAALGPVARSSQTPNDGTDCAALVV